MTKARFAENEIVKSEDVQDGARYAAESVIEAADLLVGGEGSRICGGELSASGLAVSAKPFLAFLSGGAAPFFSAAALSATASAGESEDRVDAVAASASWVDTKETRAFWDETIGGGQYSLTPVKSTLTVAISIVKGVAGAGHAPDVSSGLLKIGEVVVRAGATAIAAGDVFGVSAERQGDENAGWTAQKTAAWKAGGLAKLREILAAVANEGGLKSAVVHSGNVDWGVGAGNVNATQMPVGLAISESVSIPATYSVREALKILAATRGTSVKIKSASIEAEGEVAFSLSQLGLDTALAWEISAQIGDCAASLRSAFRSARVKRTGADEIKISAWSEDEDGEMHEGAWKYFPGETSAIAGCGVAGKMIAGSRGDLLPIPLKLTCIPNGGYSA